MDLVLKLSGSNVYVYIDDSLVTVFENKDINYVVERIQKNFKNARIHIF